MKRNWSVLFLFSFLMAGTGLARYQPSEMLCADKTADGKKPYFFAHVFPGSNHLTEAYIWSGESLFSDGSFEGDSKFAFCGLPCVPTRVVAGDTVTYEHNSRYYDSERTFLDLRLTVHLNTPSGAPLDWNLPLAGTLEVVDQNSPNPDKPIQLSMACRKMSGFKP